MKLFLELNRIDNMFNRYGTKGVFLSFQDSGEANRFFNVYTADYGKIKLFARSIRKKESKLRFGTGFFFLNEIEFIEGKNYRTLTDVKIIDDYWLIRKSLMPSALAYKACQDIDLLVKDKEQDTNIWLLFTGFLKEINKKESEVGLSAYFHFVWKLFSFLGYHPEIEKCVFCRKIIKTPPFYFSASEGGAVGSCCFQKNEDAKEITETSIGLLKVFSRKELIFPNQEINNKTKKELQEIGDNYLKHLSSR